jgi:hypothetical protein
MMQVLRKADDANSHRTDTRRNLHFREGMRFVCAIVLSGQCLCDEILDIYYPYLSRMIYVH